MNTRFFRASEAVYSAVLEQVNAAWGLPSNGQETAFDFAADAPRDRDGLCYLAVMDRDCLYEPIATILPQLLASGAVEEITREQYGAATL